MTVMLTLNMLASTRRWRKNRNSLSPLAAAMMPHQQQMQFLVDAIGAASMADGYLYFECWRRLLAPKPFYASLRQEPNR